MNKIAAAGCLVFIVSVSAVSAQINQGPAQTPSQIDRVESIAGDVSRIARSMEGLTRNWKDFFSAFSTNQGLQLTQRQQKILLALEVLNRGEQRIANLQRMKLDASERLTNFRLQAARINDDLLPESIDRYAALRGALNADELRNVRRQALQRERMEVTTLINDVQRDLDAINNDLRQMEYYLRNIRARLFPEIERELADL